LTLRKAGGYIISVSHCQQPLCQIWMIFCSKESKKVKQQLIEGGYPYYDQCGHMEMTENMIPKKDPLAAVPVSNSLKNTKMFQVLKKAGYA
jgi:hypothetical protein